MVKIEVIELTSLCQPTIRYKRVLRYRRGRTWECRWANCTPDETIRQQLRDKEFKRGDWQPYCE